MRIFCFLLFIIFSAFSQDTSMTNLTNRLFPNGEISFQKDKVSIHDTLLTHDTILISPGKCRYVSKYEEKLKTDSAISYYKSILDTAYDPLLRTNLKFKMDSSLKKWLLSYPEESKLYRQKKLFVGYGVSQIIAGICGVIFTAIDPNSERSFSYDVPVFSSKGIQTGTKEQSIKYKTGWQPYHTGILLLSIGFVVSGIISINF